MRSKAHFKSHPIHPILVAFPIAFFIGAFVFDTLSLVLEKENLNLVAGYMIIAGIISGLAAAIPGIIDFIYTVPPNSSAKKRGAKHGILNTTVIIIFLISFIIRDNEGLNFFLILGLELLGVVLLTISGWMGGTLVYRNQIGVNIRYAEAGKWKEQHHSEATDLVEVASLDELQVNQMKLLHISGKRIVLARSEEGYVAFDDRCPHKGGSLIGGSMMCGTVQCPWHGSQFEVHSGKVTAGPAENGIAVYKVQVEGQKVFLKL